MGDPTKHVNKILSAVALSNSAGVLEKSSKAILTQVADLKRGPQLLVSGVDAINTIARILPSATPITVVTGFGPVELKPGTIWSGDRILVSADTVYARYAIRDELYEWSTSEFLRAEWFAAAGRATAQAEVFVHLAKFEIAMLSGIFVPWYLLFGLSVASIGLSCYHNRDTYRQALREAPAVLRRLQDLRERSPTLFNKLLKTAAKDVLANLPAGVTAEDVGFFIGRVIGGLGGGPFHPFRPATVNSVQVTLGAVLRTVVKVGLLVTATHLPQITAEAVAAAARARAAELQARLADEGITVTQEEAEKILRELLAKPDTHQKLRELEQHIGQLIPVLERLSQVLHR
jgi:hypothetical protein